MTSLPPHAPTVAIVIPAYNEGEVIGGVISGLTEHYDTVIVVDDCSTDDTAARASAAGATVLRHVINLGQGAALQTGIAYALRADADLIVTFDADGQHRVADIPVLVDTLTRRGCDVVTGSRFLGSAENIPRARRLMLRAAVAFTRFTTGLKLTDAHNGLRVMTRSAASKLRIRQNRMAHASELVDQFSALGFKLAEAPVTIIYTQYSLAKGQKMSNAIFILFELLLGRLSKR